MNDTSAIVLATFVGVLGYVLGIQKLKAETLWKEKYAALKQLTEAAEKIVNLSSHEELIGLGVKTISDEELDSIKLDAMAAKKDIGQSISFLEILFKEKQIEAIKNQYDDLLGYLAKVEESRPGPEFRGDFHAEVQGTARSLQLEVIKLARRKIT